MGTPFLETVKWINRLVSFNQIEQKPVILKWPRIWVEKIYL
jgi:hypothetical protein